MGINGVLNSVGFAGGGGGKGDIYIYVYIYIYSTLNWQTPKLRWIVAVAQVSLQGKSGKSAYIAF